MEYKKIEEQYLNEFLNIWNEEYSEVYPLTDFLLRRNITECINIEHDASMIVLDQNKFVGLIVCKVWKESFIVEGYQDIGWISMLYVNPQYRHLGIGTQLISKAEDIFIKLGKKSIYLGKDPNNFFPGIPSEFHIHYTWFSNRGYKLSRDTFDLMRSINSNSTLIELPNIEFDIEYLSSKTFSQTIEFMNKNFPGRWTYELVDYIKKGGTGKEYLILRDNDFVIGFCRINDMFTNVINYNMTWSASFEKPAGIGPLGIDEKYRKLHLGYYIVAYATNELINRQVSNIVIDWTSLITFYQKFGFEIWKRYRYSQKNIKI